MKGGKFNRPEDATMSFQAYDPGVEKVGLLSPDAKLTSLRANLSACAVRYNESGVIFENFVKNIRGVGPIPMKGIKMFLTRTRSSLFLISDTSPESLYEITKAFMDVDFKKKCILEKENGKLLYLFHISSEEATKVRSIAAQEQPATQKPRIDTLVPQEEAIIVDLEDFKKKLKACSDIISDSTGGFNINNFADKIRFVSTFKDDNDDPYYFVISGDNENTYRLYVNREPENQEGYLATTTFIYKTDVCILCLEG